MTDYKENLKNGSAKPRNASRKSISTGLERQTRRRRESGGGNGAERRGSFARKRSENQNRSRKVEVGKQAARAAGETAKKALGSERARPRSRRRSGDKAADAFGKTTVEAEKTIKTAGRRAGEVIGAAGARAATVFEDARGTFESAASGVSKAFNLGANWTRAFDSTFKAVRKTGDWIAENPAQAAATGASMAVGVGLGRRFYRHQFALAF
jgi:ElaB/YqjD/DUF883 family membrane-anchored ribosome-binding protein